MKVGGRDTRAVWWSGEGVRYIDQRLLPARLEFGCARTVEEVAHAIETMAVRGARGVAATERSTAAAATRGRGAKPARTRAPDLRPSPPTAAGGA